MAGITWWLVLFLAEPVPPLRGIESYRMESQSACSNMLETVDWVTASKGSDADLRGEGKLPPRLDLAARNRSEMEVLACVDGGTLKALRSGKLPHQIAVFEDAYSAPTVVMDVSPPTLLRDRWDRENDH